MTPGNHHAAERDQRGSEPDTVARFESEIAALDEVIDVRRMFGLPDYVVRVGTPDLDTYEAFVTAGLGAVPGVGVSRADPAAHRPGPFAATRASPSAGAPLSGRSWRRSGSPPRCAPEAPTPTP
jgi:hypothetical protein